MAFLFLIRRPHSYWPLPSLGLAGRQVLPLPQKAIAISAAFGVSMMTRKPVRQMLRSWSVTCDSLSSASIMVYTAGSNITAAAGLSAVLVSMIWMPSAVVLCR